MLTCETVRNRLPGLLTGERAEPDVREHLATCEACRGERERLAVEIARLRDGLTALSPSPLLEGALVDAAAAPAEPRPPRPWRQVGIAAIAAAALLLFVVLPQFADEDGESLPIGDRNETDPSGRTAAAVMVPPSAGQVEGARRANLAAMPPTENGPSTTMTYTAVRRGGGLAETHSEAFLPPAPDALHRFAAGDVDGQAAEKVFRVTTWPRDGVMLLGTGLLKRIGGTVRVSQDRPSDGMSIRVGARRWRANRDTAEAELLIGSPETSGSRARVRVLISTGYDGTLMLEEPMARALGLHQFEIPGGVHFDEGQGPGATPFVGSRARARIRIEELDFDEVVEIQIVPCRAWKPTGAEDDRGLRLEWMAARTITAGHRLVVDSNAPDMRLMGGVTMVASGQGVKAMDPGDGAYAFGVHFADLEGAVPHLPDVPLLGSLFRGQPTTLFTTTLDCGPGWIYPWEVERTTVFGPLEVGAKVVIARAWRGRTAVPSREAVVVTTVHEDGRLEFPRMPGEAGATLRMLVTTKDGTSTFHDVVVDSALDTSPTIPVGLAANGNITVDSRVDLTLVDTPEAQAEALARVRDSLSRLVEINGGRDARGRARATLAVTAEDGVGWRMVQWILQIAASPSVGIDRIRFRTPYTGTVYEHRLPTDGGLDAPPDTTPQLTATLSRKDAESALTVRITREDTGALVEWQSDARDVPLKGMIEALRGSEAVVRGLVRTSPPQSPVVRYEDVLRVLDAFREAGIEGIVFEGAPLAIR